MRMRLGAEPPPGEAGLTEREQRAAQAATEPTPRWPLPRPPRRQLVFERKRLLGDVWNQASCGSCVAFGTIAAMEGSTRVATKKPGMAFNLSEAHLFYCHAAARLVPGG